MKLRTAALFAAAELAVEAADRLDVPFGTLNLLPGTHRVQVHIGSAPAAVARRLLAEAGAVEEPEVQHFDAEGGSGRAFDVLTAPVPTPLGPVSVSVFCGLDKPGEDQGSAGQPAHVDGKDGHDSTAWASGASGATEEPHLPADPAPTTPDEGAVNDTEAAVRELAALVGEADRSTPAGYTGQQVAAFLASELGVFAGLDTPGPWDEATIDVVADLLDVTAALTIAAWVRDAYARGYAVHETAANEGVVCTLRRALDGEQLDGEGGAS